MWAQQRGACFEGTYWDIIWDTLRNHRNVYQFPLSYPDISHNPLRSLDASTYPYSVTLLAMLQDTRYCSSLLSSSSSSSLFFCIILWLILAPPKKWQGHHSKVFCVCGSMEYPTWRFSNSSNDLSRHSKSSHTFPLLNFSLNSLPQHYVSQYFKDSHPPPYILYICSFV